MDNGVSVAAAIAPDPRGAEWRRRLALCGLTVTVAPMRPDEIILPIDLLCSRSRPRRTPHREWRDFYEPQARRIVATHRVLVATTVFEKTRIALGLLMLTPAGAVRMVYVKLRHRGHGIGLLLLDSANVPEVVPVVEAEPGWKRWAAFHGLQWRIAG